MPGADPERRREATAIFKRALQVDRKAIHRTQNRAPSGKGWVQCVNAPAGVLCRPPLVREAIALYALAYETFPDIVALNQQALCHEMLGEFGVARALYARMKAKAVAEGLAPYASAADLGMARTRE